MPTVLVASDKSKGSLTPAEVVEAVTAGLRRTRADVKVDVVPVADGGDRTLAPALAAGLSRVPVKAAGPTGEVVAAAVEAGCRQAMLGIGGSASTHGGSGLVRVLGARLLDGDGTEIGEGSLDEQTLHGEAAAGVAATAWALDIPVAAVSGHNTFDLERLQATGIWAAYALTEDEPEVQRCMGQATPSPARLGERIAAEHLFA